MYGLISIVAPSGYEEGPSYVYKLGWVKLSAQGLGQKDVVFMGKARPIFEPSTHPIFLSLPVVLLSFISRFVLVL